MDMVYARIQGYIMGYTIQVEDAQFTHAYDTKENNMWKE